MTKRRPPNKTEKLAAVLLMIKRGDKWLIPEPQRSSGDAKAICACVQWDHLSPHAVSADDRPQNYDPKSPEDHLAKTKVDVKRIAKGKRLARKQEEFRRKLLARSGQLPRIDVRGGMDGGQPHKKPKRTWPKRPFPGSKKDKALRAQRNAR